LAEGHYRLALAYARVSGIRLNRKQATTTRRPRDPDRPKRPPTAYLLFSVDKRPSVNAEFPGLRSQDVASKIGEAWRGLDTQARERYTDIAAGLRKKYFSDVKAYKRKLFDGHVPLDDEDEDEDEEDIDAADDDGIDTAASQEPDLSQLTPAATNGQAKRKKRRPAEPGSEKPRKSKSKGDAGDAEAPKKKKKKRTKAAAE
ncbi:High mobility group box 1, partial [Coemansia helicoidea]